MTTNSRTWAKYRTIWSVSPRQSLGELAEDYEPDGDEDEDAQVSASAVRELHFGGGLVPKRPGEGDSDRHRFVIIYDWPQFTFLAELTKKLWRRS